jgi:hypothetical protein
MSEEEFLYLVPAPKPNSIIRSNNNKWISGKAINDNFKNSVLKPSKFKTKTGQYLDTILGIKNNKFVNLVHPKGDKKVLIYNNNKILWSENAVENNQQILSLGTLTESGEIIIRNSSGDILFRANNSGILMGRDLDMNNRRATLVANGTNPNDAINFSQLASAVVPPIGANISLQNIFQIRNSVNGTNLTDGVTVEQAKSYISDLGFRNLYICDIYNSSGSSYQSSSRMIDYANSLNYTIKYLPRTYTISNGYLLINSNANPLFSVNLFEGEQFGMYIKFQYNAHIATSALFHGYSNTFYMYGYMTNGNGTNARNMVININGNYFETSTNNLIDNGIYHLFITKNELGRYGIFLYNSNKTLITSNIQQFIVSQPLSQIVNVGTNVTFSVLTAGAGTVAYNWTANNIPNTSGLLWWLDASDTSSLVISNGRVVEWRDKMNNLVFAQSNASIAPTYSTVGTNLPSVYFLNTSIQMLSTTNNNQTGNVSRSMFVVSKNDTASSTMKIGTGPHAPASPPSTYGFDFLNSGNINFHPYVYTGSDVTSAGIFTDLTIGYSFYNNATSTVGGYINNTSNTLTKTTTLNTLATPWYLGRRPDTAGSTQSHICEVLYYNRVLSQSERERVEGYLANKWGILGLLPASHPFKVNLSGTINTASYTLTNAQLTDNNTNYMCRLILTYNAITYPPVFTNIATLTVTSSPIVVPLASIPTGLVLVNPAPEKQFLSWLPSSNAIYYNVQRALNNTFTLGLVTTTNILTTNFSISGLAISTTYYYRVQAVNQAGTPSAYSSSISLTTFINTAPVSMELYLGSNILIKPYITYYDFGIFTAGFEDNICRAIMQY